MGFFMKSRGVADVPCYENIPCGAIVPQIGLALAIIDGVLKVCTGTETPGYVSDAKRDEAVEEGAVIPVIKVCEDMIFETESTASFEGVKLGDKVTISEDGAGVTATTGGACEVVYISEEAKAGAGGKVLVRIV